jgi:hypothetical protein
MNTDDADDHRFFLDLSAPISRIRENQRLIFFGFGFSVFCLSHLS